MTPTQVKAKIWMSAAKGAVLPFATLMVVLFMMVPVPAVMLDIGFITNIMISLAVLMVALNACQAARLFQLSDGAAVRDPAAPGAQRRLDPRRAGVGP